MHKIYSIIIFYCFNVLSVFALPYDTLLAQLKVDRVKAFQFIKELNKFELKILIVEKDSLDQLYLFSGKANEVKIQYPAPSGLEFFKYLNIFTHSKLEYPVFVTHWMHGTHGEKLILHYFKDNQWKMQSYIHEWPMVSVFKKDELAFIKMSSDPNNTTSEIIWNP